MSSKLISSFATAVGITSLKEERNNKRAYTTSVFKSSGRTTKYISRISKRMGLHSIPIFNCSAATQRKIQVFMEPIVLHI